MAVERVDRRESVEERGAGRYRVISPILPSVLGRFASGRFFPVSGSFRSIQNLIDSESFRPDK